MIIDVDAFEDVKPPQPPKPSRKPFTGQPIVISDDEADTLEVATKLKLASTSLPQSRSLSKDSDIEIIPPVIDLVSDDDEKPEIPAVTRRRSSALKQASTPASGKTARTPLADAGGSTRAGPSRAAPHVKPKVNDPGSSRHNKNIIRGPKSIINESKSERRNILRHLSDEIDSEEEYETTGGFNPFRHPTESPSRRVEPPAPSSEPKAKPSKKRPFNDISSIPALPAVFSAPGSEDIGVWDILRELGVTYDISGTKRPRLATALNMERPSLTSPFRRAGGSINKILQHDGRLVVCSNTAGGNDTGDTDPYNKAGTLISWCKRNPMKLLDLEQGDEEDLSVTHYSVHCIDYDATSNILAASGAEKSVRTWKFNHEDDDEPYVESESYQFKVRSRLTSPHEIVFKPGSSVLAVGEQSLTLQDVSEENSERHSYSLVPTRKEQDAHVVGAIAWGCGLSSHLVFALSEPVAKNDHRGHHKAIDTEALTLAFTFDASEAGDALCVDPGGQTAALVTTNGTHSFLRIYDVARGESKAIHTERLTAFTSDEHEVNSMAFSSDGIYLAIGRDDNRTHVYDSRMLNRGYLFDYQHSAARLCSRYQSFFGIVKVEWVQTRTHRLGLVTGGNDGTVRLWDPLCTPAEATVLAQVNSDVATFSLGDPFKGEHGLVVGDSDGAVYVMEGPANM
ncbi:WD40-repeat-containing domain protein [Mycena crocata]|nr:WD40-repeat-containing domain protein [Mycena crocata]